MLDREAVADLVRRSKVACQAVASLDQNLGRARQDVVAAFNQVRDARVWSDLASMPIDRVRDVTGGRLRLGALHNHGYRTVADVLRAGPSRLQHVPGVGESTAPKVFAAAEQIRRAVVDSIKVRIDLDPNDQATTALLRALRVWEGVASAEDRIEGARTFAVSVAAASADAAPAAASPVRRLFMGNTKKSAGAVAAAHLADLLAWGRSTGIESESARVANGIRHFMPDPELWADFEKRSPVYYGLLGGLVDLGLDVAAADGFLPAEIVERINAQPLDDTLLLVPLRGYQSFGARFALVQRRVVIGDEMGLGKTMQAIAAMAHLATGGPSHFLVVCPASVLINWTREVAKHSKLTPFTLHGPARARAAQLWRQRGGVGVTTFEALSALSLGDTVPAMLVVDEAHYVKNPRAKRSQAVACMAGRAERVLFLSGTPMENRVEEFRALVHYLQPEVARQIEPRHGIAGADAFRRAVAPVYLRRNQQDVLTELPELLQIEEWEQFGRHDGAVYRSAVAAGNFMAMRRAAFAVPDPRGSAKLERLLEIADEANANGRKVVVFSYFRDVLEIVARALGDRAFGPLTGSTPPVARQRVVDDFANSTNAGALVAQIEAGGVGLNIQAASVVILCEPQVKPTTEAQAIARAHRMGQVRTVQVHRLLVADSVDQRMLEILGTKKLLFDAYVRDSALTAAAPGAVDISESQLARTIVEKEQERLALASLGIDSDEEDKD
ncbi:ATP-dependent helicase [Cellulomonas fimi]|uniref:ATP-dependent helicase n=1 Tax=Cellulomonas fimi TaxID=1708 RepID=A0A7Y0LXI9_CELFI|nr:ATP-dependent helicase [Cellulomonas fimi]